jgi:voltage-gated potassium channel
MVAIPTGIISAGFVEEYQRAQRLSDIQKEENIHFIETEIRKGDKWIGKMIRELGMPKSSLIAAIVRDGKTIIPRGDIVITAGDKLIICAEAVKDDYLTGIREIELKQSHAWNGHRIKELDLSRQSFILLVNRKGKMMIPDGDLVLRAGDKILLYSKESKSRYLEETI